MRVVGEYESITPRSYEITEIELLDSPVLPAEATKNTIGISNNSISGANLLKNVRHPYDKGVKFLDIPPNTSEFMKIDLEVQQFSTISTLHIAAHARVQSTIVEFNKKV